MPDGNQLDDDQSGGTEPQLKRRDLLQTVAAGAVAAPAVGQIDRASGDLVSREGGPIILMGLDSEQSPGSSNHGPPDEHAAMVQAILNEVTNGGTGILVIGAASGDATQYWHNDIEPRVNTYVDSISGASTIRNADFSGYAMIGVASSDNQISGGTALTSAENDALIERRDDIADFVNDGGGLLGKTQHGFHGDGEWGYVDQLGEFAATTDSYSSANVTDEGKELGLTQSGMDGWCCYHETFTSYPEEIFDVLIYKGGTSSPAAIGGFEVELQRETEFSFAGPDAVEVGETADYDLTLTNLGPAFDEPVKFVFEIERQGGIEAGDIELEYYETDGGYWSSVSLEEDEALDDDGILRDVLVGSMPEDEVTVGSDFEGTWELRFTFAEEGIASEMFTLNVEAVGVGDEQAVYGDGSISVLTSWTFDRGAPIRTSPTYGNGLAFIGGDNGIICAVDPETGDGVWSVDMGGQIVGSPFFNGGCLYVTSTNGSVYCINPDTGDVNWSTTLSDPIYGSPSRGYGSLYVATDGGRLYALDPDTGSTGWSTTLGSGPQIRSSLTLANGRVYVGADDGRVYSVHPVTGDVDWTYDTGDRVRSSPTFRNGLLAVGSDTGTLSALDADTGSERWSAGTGGPIRSSPTIADGMVIFGSDDGTVYARSVSDGSDIWEFDAPEGAVRSSATVAGGLVYFGADDGVFYAVTRDRGLFVWGFQTGDAIDISSPTVADGRVFIGSTDGFLYGIDAGIASHIDPEDSRMLLGTLGCNGDILEAQSMAVVTITETNSTITERDRLEVTTEVESIGSGGTYTIALDVEGIGTVAYRDVVLGRDETTEVPLRWSTDVGHAGDREATVQSHADDDSTDVTIDALDYFEIDITSTNAPIAEGNILEVTAEVENLGDIDGEQTITFDLNGEEIDSTAVAILAGESETVTFQWETEEGDAGGVGVRVASEDESDNTTVVVQGDDPGEPAAFEVTITGSNAPVSTGETLQVGVEVENTGDLEGTQDIPLEINGQQVDVAEELTLAGGESEELILDWETDERNAVGVRAASDDDWDNNFLGLSDTNTNLPSL